MTAAKTTVFRAQDVESGRWICRTKAELSSRLKWLDELDDEGRVLSSHIGTSRHGFDVVEATWIEPPTLD